MFKMLSRDVRLGSGEADDRYLHPSANNLSSKSITEASTKPDALANSNNSLARLAPCQRAVDARNQGHTGSRD